MKTIFVIFCFTLLVSTNLVESAKPKNELAKPVPSFHLKARQYEGVNHRWNIRLPGEPFKVALEQIDGVKYIIGAVIDENLVAFVTNVPNEIRGVKFVIRARDLINVRIPDDSPLIDRFNKPYKGTYIRYATRTEACTPGEPGFPSIDL